MCTALTLQTEEFYFGRNMDIEYSFGEQVVIVPRKFSLKFKKMETLEHHYAMMGMAAIIENTPLFAEGFNEKGLCVAGLNFPQFAHYEEQELEGKYNIAPYEIIAFLLGKCDSVDSAVKVMEEFRIVAIPFQENIPLASLHFIIADKEKSVVLEQTQKGVSIHQNPFGILTNNPPFDFHMNNISQYMAMSSKQPTNCIYPTKEIKAFSQGFGALGLPGDFSSASRFVKTAFLKGNSRCELDNDSSIVQFFHILESVAFVKGAVMTLEDKEDITLYSCCCNIDQMTYYYKTYENSQITGIKLQLNDVDHEKMKVFPLRKELCVYYQEVK
ncbi:MAG: choloylglycine hydrolase [Eubacteriales bacterium]